jgi:hypothetical protein
MLDGKDPSSRCLSFTLRRRESQRSLSQGKWVYVECQQRVVLDDAGRPQFNERYSGAAVRLTWRSTF